METPIKMDDFGSTPVFLACLNWALLLCTWWENRSILTLQCAFMLLNLVVVSGSRKRWIYCQLVDYMPPTTFYGNQKQPLKHGNLLLCDLYWFVHITNAIQDLSWVKYSAIESGSFFEDPVLRCRIFGFQGGSRSLHFTISPRDQSWKHLKTPQPLKGYQRIAKVAMSSMQSANIKNIGPHVTAAQQPGDVKWLDHRQVIQTMNRPNMVQNDVQDKTHAWQIWISQPTRICVAKKFWKGFLTSPWKVQFWPSSNELKLKWDDFFGLEARFWTPWKLMKPLASLYEHWQASLQGQWNFQSSFDFETAWKNFQSVR